MKVGDIVRPLMGRKKSAGVTLNHLQRCEVLKYILPKTGETHPVVELKVIDGYGRATPDWRSIDKWGSFNSRNKTLNFQSPDVYNPNPNGFNQPLQLDRGTVFRAFASAFTVVQESTSPPPYQAVAAPRAAVPQSDWPEYTPPSLTNIRKIMALRRKRSRGKT